MSIKKRMRITALVMFVLAVIVAAGFGGVPKGSAKLAESISVVEAKAASAKYKVKKIFKGELYTVKTRKKLKKKIEDARKSSISGWYYDVDYAEDAAVTDSAAGGVAVNANTADSAASAPTASATGGSSDYSSTNLRELGVDEGDIVKTDGSFIYSYNDSGQVRIIKADGQSMMLIAKFTPDFVADDSQIRDMYISGNKMILTADTYVFNFDTFFINRNKRYRITDTNQTVVVAYDISDRTAPKVEATFSVEGNYHSSRIVGGYLYMFTWYDGSEIPLIMDKQPKVSDVYLCEDMSGFSTFTMTSVALDKPAEKVDAKVIYAPISDVYVSTKSIYLQDHDYMNGRSATNLMKFNYSDGNFVPVGIGTVPGYLESSFSIDENNGVLRVATTFWGIEQRTNGVYTFDENMNRLGKLSGIAKKEEIKSARFMGNMLYLVTYENHDPLFSIDLTDPAHPEVVGQLEIPGFSDYLHFWDDTHLLGIGYDTDEETSAVKGMKLSMFDISDPKAVKEVATKIFSATEVPPAKTDTEAEADTETNTEEEESWSSTYHYDSIPALSNYRALLIDPAKNLIGFSSSSRTYYYGTNYYSRKTEESFDYFVFSYQDGQFVQKMDYKLDSSVIRNVRGLYIGNMFYINDDSYIKSFGMEGFTESGSLKY